MQKMSFRQKMHPVLRNPSRYALFAKNEDFSISRSVALILCLVVFLSVYTGCSRQHYRVKADKEVYSLLESGGTRDCRWQLNDYRIEVDPRSRMHNRYDPDCEPMPPDDASAHVKMRHVDGKKGSKHWHDCGCTKCVENPNWRQYLLYNDKGAVPLDISGTVELALLHSPEYQSALEALYLSAANVSRERFAFDVQFVGKESLFYEASGGLRNPSSSTLTNDVSLEASKLFATGGELVAGMANSVTWSFCGPDTWRAESLFNLSLVQPLLRNAGRKVVLEKLTQSERNFLATIREMVFYQQEFYTKIVTGSNSQSAVISASLPSGGSGYHELLMQQIRIRNLRQNIIGLEGNLHRFQALFESNQIDDPYQVEDVRQGVLSNESSLLDQIASYEGNVETFLRSLGLPPDLKVEIADPLIDQFQLTSTTITTLQEDISDLFTKVRKIDEALPDDFADSLEEMILRTQSEIVVLENDLKLLEKRVPDRVAGLKTLEKHLSEHIRQGERIEPIVYDSNEFLERVEKLKNVEIPKNKQKLEAVFLLLRLIIEYDELTLRQMIKENNFPEEIQKAKEMLRVDSESINLENVAEKLEEIEKSREIRDSLKGFLEKEGHTPSLELPPLVPKPPRSEVKDPFLLGNEKTETDTPGPAPTPDELVGDDPERQEIRKLIGQLKEYQSDDYREWVRNALMEFQNEVASLAISQIRVRLETITLLPTTISPEEAFCIAEENRLDWMNQRATLVDAWRQIDIKANQLKGDLNVRVEGEYGRIDQNGVNMDSSTGQVRVGLEWDTPLNRHSEMHAYRKSQIDYQAARRRYYTYVDSVQAEIRDILRDIRLRQVDFEIQRHMILIAAIKVDMAQLELIKPAERGKGIDTNTSQRLISSLNSMASTQNVFISSWLDYQKLRMILDLNMGTMELDAQGRWIDPGQITKDRLGPVLRAGSRNAVPGMVPSNRKIGKVRHSKRMAVRRIAEQDWPVPDAPRLDGEIKEDLENEEPILAPEPEAPALPKDAEEPKMEPVPPEPATLPKLTQPKPIRSKPSEKAALHVATLPDPPPVVEKHRPQHMQPAPSPPKSPE